MCAINLCVLFLHPLNVRKRFQKLSLGKERDVTKLMYQIKDRLVYYFFYYRL